MALNYFYEKIDNYEELMVDPPAGSNPKARRRLGPLTETLILLTLPMGVREITESNVGEVWARLDMLQRIQGAFLNRYSEEAEKIEDVWFTAEDVIRHIGLSTNAAELTRNQFLMNVVKSAMDESALRTKRELKEKLKTGAAA